jgi:hypothetical protein
MKRLTTWLVTKLKATTTMNSIVTWKAKQSPDIVRDFPSLLRSHPGSGELSRTTSSAAVAKEMKSIESAARSSSRNNIHGRQLRAGVTVHSSRMSRLCWTCANLLQSASAAAVVLLLQFPLVLVAYCRQQKCDVGVVKMVQVQIALSTPGD